MNNRPPGIKAEPSPMGGVQQQMGGYKDPKRLLPTLIYDYFLKTRQPDLAQAVFNKGLVETKERTKASPSGRDMNGITDGMPKDEISEKIEKMPLPDIGAELSNESFLQDWFCTFWDIWSASRMQTPNKQAEQFVQNANRMKNQNMMMNNRMAAGRMMGNGMNSMQGQAMMNSLQRRNPMVPQGQMTQAGAEGQRPQSPMSGDNQPSPKRQRLEAGFPNPAMGNGGNPGAPGQPPNMPGNMDPSQFGLMNGMGMMDPESRMQNPQGGALADYQMQLMLLEQQNKRRLLMARQEQEVTSQTGPPGATGQPAIMNQQNMPFAMPPGTSPRRNGQSPSPNDPMKRNPSQMGQSPRPDGMAVTRGSPAPGMFDAHNAQQVAMASQHFFPNGAMRPNGMGPNGPQAMMQGPNGQVRPMGMQGPRPGGPGGQFPQAMQPFGQGGQPQPQNPNNPAGNPQGQPPGSMPPPQAPANQPGRTNPSSPAPGQAPPTPRGKDAGPKKKEPAKKDAGKAKQQPKKAGATPSSEAEAQHPPTPTPSTPVDPHPPPSVLSKTQPNGNQQPTAGPNGMQAQAGAQPDAMAGMEQQQMAGMAGVGDANADSNIGDFNFDFNNPTTDVLDGFDFDSFLQVDGDTNNFDFSTQGFDMSGGMGTELTDNPH